MTETLEILPMVLSTKETTMELEENYDVVEEHGKDKPRALRIGDVLKRGDDRGLIVGAVADDDPSALVLVDPSDGYRWGNPVAVEDIDAITREEAEELTEDELADWSLLGHAQDVLTVNDPGE